ncbi:MAG: response regulator [Gammaproteobacteria bacterium]|nr:response regulator [Gammaproteobacteria bacterium]
MQELMILVVDDMRSMRAIVKGVLQDMGFDQLMEAGDGQEALSVLRSRRVDLVVCDVEMPKMSGIELLDEVDKDGTLNSVPFIMLTAMNQRDKVQEILKHQVFDFVLKPINPKMLEDRVQAFLDSREPQDIPDLDG